MDHLLIFSGVAAVTLSATHVFVNRLAFLQGIPRNKWLSIAGGISVAYIFLLNVLKEALPEERKSSYWAFFAGITGYTVLLLLVG